MTIYQSTLPRDCAYCAREIVADGHGGWVHVHGRGYGCRDRTNILIGTKATPKPHTVSTIEIGRGHGPT